MTGGEPPGGGDPIRAGVSERTGSVDKTRVRVVYGLERLREEMRRVDELLDEPVEAYLIGGCAMSYAGTKTATKDIDLVLRDAADLSRVRRALEALGYAATTKVDPAYEGLGAAGYFDKAASPRWDVYVLRVCGKLQLSPGMVSRATREEPDLKRLRIQRVAPSDIFIFKSITERPEDKDDLDRLYGLGLRWDIVLEEMQWQCLHSEVAWSAAFVGALEDLASEGKTVPILDPLRELADRQVGEIAVLRRVREGATTSASVVKAMGEDPAWVKGLIEGLVRRGAIVERDGILRIP